MRPKLLVYVTADELAEMRRESKRQHISLSRYTKRRLMLASDTDDAVGEPAAPENRADRSRHEGRLGPRGAAGR